MNTKIIIIHSFNIISHGLSGIIKKRFELETLALDSIDALLNYTSISGYNLLILADAYIESKSFLAIVDTFRKQNQVKVIRIYKSEKDRQCKSDCDCCFAIDANTNRLTELLNPLIIHKKNRQNQKKSTGLTERERDVIKLVALGKTNKEIADELFISIHTVISHRKNITEKLGIKSISGLTVFAILNNLIDTSTIDPNGLI